MFSNLDILAGQYVLRRVLSKPAVTLLGRPFLRPTDRRLVIYYEPNAISFTQAFPFLFYAARLRDRFGLQLRCYPNTKLLAGDPVRQDHADIVLLQTWFTITANELRRVLERLKEANPKAAISFVDSFAHSDVRLAGVLEPHIDFYLKKSLFRDQKDFFRPFRGDTNLTEYYGDLYGIEADPVDWHVPKAILPKLRLSPNFFTAPRFLQAFATEEMPPAAGRPLDIQTRFGKRGTEWYQTMREDALANVRAIPGLALSPTELVSYPQYMKEMRQSKLCFSPHGYGELCWRDIESILAGAVLIKPDMSHLKTLPDIYRPGVTYLPVKWDFSDLEEVVRMALADTDLRAEIAGNAFRTIVDYVRQARFVDDMAFLLKSPGKQQQASADPTRANLLTK